MVILNPDQPFLWAKRIEKIGIRHLNILEKQ